MYVQGSLCALLVVYLQQPSPPPGPCCPIALLQTVELLALMLANPAPALPPGVHKTPSGLIKSRWG